MTTGDFGRPGEAALAAVARGYRALKFDPFGSSFFEFTPAERRRSLHPIEAVRSAVGPDIELYIEMHGRFTPSGAAWMAREIAPLRPGWLEEPVPPENLRALGKLARAIAPLGIPIATGERIHTPADARELIERQACDILQTDISQFGGLANARKIAALADLAHIRMAPHNVGGPVATAVALHFNACTTNAFVQENFNDFDAPHVMAAAPGNPTLGSDGCVALPTGPGLGVEVDEAVLAAHPPGGIHFDLRARDWQKREG